MMDIKWFIMASMIHIFFDKKTSATRAQPEALLSEDAPTRPMRDKSASGGAAKSEVMSKEEFSEEL